MPIIPNPSDVTEVDELAEALDRADHAARVEWMNAMPTRDMDALYDLAKGSAVDIDHFAPTEDRVHIHDGRNSMLLFSDFQKRFARVPERIFGYNHPGKMGRAVTWFQGYGHFVLRPSPDVEGEVWIDYTEVHDDDHPEFPKTQDNDGLPRWFRTGK